MIPFLDSTAREARAAQSRTRRDELALKQMHDGARLGFLLKLRDSKISLTEWEHQFVHDFIAHPRGFDDNQIGAVEELKRKYERRLP